MNASRGEDGDFAAAASRSIAKARLGESVPRQLGVGDISSPREEDMIVGDSSMNSYLIHFGVGAGRARLIRSKGCLSSLE
jgi:hypothetical protein